MKYEWNYWEDLIPCTDFSIYKMHRNLQNYFHLTKHLRRSMRSEMDLRVGEYLLANPEKVKQENAVNRKRNKY